MEMMEFNCHRIQELPLLFVFCFFKEFQFLTLQFKGERDGVVGEPFPKTTQLEYLGPVLCDTNFPPQCCDLR